MLRGLCVVALLAALCCAAAGCTSGKPGLVAAGGLTQSQVDSPPIAPVRGFAWPAPSELRPLLHTGHQASYTDSDLVQVGAEMVSALPNQHAAVVVPSVTFSPSYSGPSATFEDLAFAMFAFDNLQDYDRNDVVYSSWASLPVAGTAFVGLADWSNDCWDWFAIGPIGRVSLSAHPGDPLGDYIDFGGTLLAAVVVTGNIPLTLQSLRLGTLPPQAEFSASPSAGMVPLQVQFDASASTDPDGDIIKYEWDINGDGTYELTGSPIPTVQSYFNLAGTMNVTLRVTDNLGATGVIAHPVYILSPWSHTWGRSDSDSFSSVLVHGDRIYVAGTIATNGAGSGGDAYVCALNPDGSVVWSKQWNSGEPEGIIGLAISQDGSALFAVGNLDVGDFNNTTDWLIQAWSSDGDLLWAKRVGSTWFDYCYAAVVLEGDLFVCGNSRMADLNNSHATIMRLTAAGDVVWQRTWGGTGFTRISACCPSPALLGSPYIGLLGDTTAYGAGGSDLLYLKFSLDEELLTSMTWGDAGDQKAGGICSDLFRGTYATCIDYQSPHCSVLLKVNAGAPGLAVGISGPTELSLAPVLLTGSELLFAGKWGTNSSNADILLGRYDLDTSELLLHSLVKPGNIDSASGLALLPDGSVVVAGALENAQDVSWGPYSVTTADYTGIAWAQVSQAEAVLDVAPVTLNIIPANAFAPQDVGAGNSDCFIGLHRL